MSSLIQFIENNLTGDYGPFTQAIMLGIIFVIVRDFYSSIFGAVASWFRK